MKSSWIKLSFLCACTWSVSAGAQARRDALVQTPELKSPGRGSISGALANLEFESDVLSQGSTRLPVPMEAPSERGGPLVEIFPAYSPDQGLTEWGMGFSASSTIRRFRHLGEIDYSSSDDLSSPWGRLVRGSDGAYYPAGLSGNVRLQLTGSEWVALTPEGKRYVFRAADASSTPRGIYEWSLSEVTNLLGERTTFTYQTNTSGRRFVERISYGGRSGTHQYQVQFSYETLQTATVSYASGVAIKLDQRVSGVTVSVRNATTGQFKERYRYDLTYDKSPAGVAFYLVGVQRTFASGVQEPPTTYSYRFGEQDAASATLVRAPVLDSYLTKWQGGSLFPDVSSYVDIDRDGRIDLEHRFDNELARHTSSGLVFEPLPRDNTESVRCRPPKSHNNKPRTLVRMKRGADTQVFASVASGSFTQVSICDRQGHSQAELSLSGNGWAIGANTRLVDLDRDLQPDLIRVTSSDYQVQRNVSDASSYKFQAEDKRGLTWPAGTPSNTPLATFVQDLNGDGVPDLIARTASKFVAWFGLGQRTFQQTGTALPLFALGQNIPFSMGESYQSVFFDANRDGMVDVLLTYERTMRLFLNNGKEFRELEVPAFKNINWTISYPVTVDLEGKGEEQAIVSTGALAHSIALTSPNAGLLIKADDGKGGSIGLEYERAPATPGIVSRPPLFTTLTVKNSGTDALTYRYDYEAPVFHSLGEQLLGFGVVRRTSPVDVGEATFHHDDDIKAFPLSTTRVETITTGLPEGFYQYAENTPEASNFAGVRFFRNASTSQGMRAAVGGEVLGKRTTTTEWSSNGLCPIEQTTENVHGKLVVRQTAASVSGLANALHCLSASEQEIGTHPGRSSLDFSYTTFVDRNEAGQPTKIRMQSGQVERSLQQITYDTRHRLSTIYSPKEGMASMEYDASTDLLSAVITPAGVRADVLARDPTSDGMLGSRQSHGGSDLVRQFRYDGFERLRARWDNVSGSSESLPAETITYAFATADRPGSIVAKSLTDAGAQAYAESAQLFTAGGQAIAKLARIPEGYAVGDLKEYVRNLGREEKRWHAPLSVASAHDIGFAELRTGTRFLGVQQVSKLGHVASSEEVIQDGIVRDTELQIGVSNGKLLERSYENGALLSSRELDGERRALQLVDAKNGTTRLEYDALGRLVAVLLPDGKAQRISFDGFGAPAKTTHDGIGSVEYTYQPSTGLIGERRYLDANGALTRSTTISYDAMGRELTRKHRRKADGAEEIFETTYDGVLPDGGFIDGQVGRLTTVRGPGFDRYDTYRQDGSLLSRKLSITGFRSVTTVYAYYADGAERSVQRIVQDSVGNPLFTSTLVTERDAAGRTALVRQNGDELYRVQYDAEGRVADITLRDGSHFVPSYDLTTAKRRGWVQESADWSLTAAVDLDVRGLISQERVDFSLGSGPTSSRNSSYAYDERRFLTSQSGTEGITAYTHTVNGALSSIQDSLGNRTLLRTPTELNAGSTKYLLDNAGRVVGKGDLTLEYGPSGDITKAVKGVKQITYRYDESGQRVLKSVNGTPVLAYADGALLTPDHVIEHVVVAGQIVGILIDDDLRPVATDTRGTVVIDAENNKVSASPYGARSTAPVLAEALDFATKGIDPDLGTVRMGVRDYDAYLGQFWRPDPLISEDLDECAKSPVECDLYTYAAANPVAFTDPTGTQAVPGAPAPAGAAAAPPAKDPITLAKEYYQRAVLDIKTMATVHSNAKHFAAARALEQAAARLLGKEPPKGVLFAYGDDANNFKASYPNYPRNIFVVDMHGAPGIAAVGYNTAGAAPHWIDMDGKQLLALMRQYGYKQGDSILLLNCHGGVAQPGGKSLAQQLANEARVPVVAHSDYVWGTGPFPTGHYINGVVNGSGTDTTGTFIPGGPVIAIPEPLPPQPFGK